MALLFLKPLRRRELPQRGLTKARLTNSPLPKGLFLKKRFLKRPFRREPSRARRRRRRARPRISRACALQPPKPRRCGPSFATARDSTAKRKSRAVKAGKNRELPSARRRLAKRRKPEKSDC